MRKTLWLILLPAVLLIGGFFYLRFSLRSSIRDDEKAAGRKAVVPDTLAGKKVSTADLRPLFIRRVQQLVKKGSNGLYNLSISDVKVDVLASTLSLQGVMLTPDQA